MNFKPFQRVHNAQAIAQALSDLPPHWSLTPLRDKRPYRDRWQSEPFIPHPAIAQLLLEGEQRVSKTSGQLYRGFCSGYGLRLGEASGGLVAIDIDGASAESLLEAISGGDLPDTVSWTSGKPGRRQLLYQVPQSVRAALKDFRRKTQTHYDGQATAPGELLEFRYNHSQSVLPPSRHPDTGAYQWLRSPKHQSVAIAPDWLLDCLFEGQRQVEKQKAARKTRHKASGSLQSTRPSEILEAAIHALGIGGIYNWEGHHFKARGKQLVGFCPRHASTSGTAFQVNPETGRWYCHGCQAGGYAAQYRWFLRGGTGSPRGQVFLEIVSELAADAGLDSSPLRHQEGRRTRTLIVTVSPHCDRALPPRPRPIWEKQPIPLN